MDVKLSSASGLKGTVFVPGDKSISHRALIFAALADGESTISNLLPGADCLSTLKCLTDLGVSIEYAGVYAKVQGVGPRGFKEPVDILDVGNSGTTLRVLPGILAGQQMLTVLTGDASVRSRPMDRVIIPLKRMGADIRGRADDTRAPVVIHGGELRGIDYKMPVASAQVKTALLLAGLMGDGLTTITESVRSRDHTERFFDFYEIDNERTTAADGSYSVSVSGGAQFEARDIIVAGDISSAAFFIAAALLVKGSDIVIVDVGLNPTRIGFLEVLGDMGAKIDFADQKTLANEPAGTLIVGGQDLRSVEIGGPVIPRLIDELPILAVLATQAAGRTEISGAAELRVKESDRIANVVSELAKMGADIEEKPDGFIINGPTPLRGAIVESRGDHRLAMSLSVAALVAKGETVIKDAECIAISYPNFEATLRGLMG